MTKKLTDDDDGHPLTPDEASTAIVEGLLADLPADRKVIVRAAIEEWGSDWGNLVGSVASESDDR